MSNPKTIPEMNAVIAVFDEWQMIPGQKDHVCFSCDEGKGPQMYCTCHLKVDRYVKDNVEWQAHHFAYHYNWQPLMLVGKKIRDILDDMQSKRPKHTATNGDLIEVDIHCALSEYDIEKTHRYIHAWVIWYNDYITTKNMLDHGKDS